MIDIRQPNISAATEREQLLQIRSYLYQMAGQLQWAFNSIETGGAGAASGVYQRSQSTGQTADADPQKTFASLKNLIIKSADIVNAYYDEINQRLEGVYVAQSDFGTYAQETALEIRANSQNINQLFTNNQLISERVDGLTTQAALTNAYLKTGLLYYADDGTPVYGLEIGQTNSVGGEQVFDKFARFVADRLSFFDSNDVEVAYISDYKLYITNAEITGGLWLSGRFKIYFNNGLAFQWTGGGD